MNFSEEEYLEIINWMLLELFSLPFMAEIIENEIKSHIHCDSTSYWNITFKKIPVYMQAVERWVNFITEAPEKDCEAEFRDKFIRIPLLSRSSMSMFNSKSTSHQSTFNYKIENSTNGQVQLIWTIYSELYFSFL